MSDIQLFEMIESIKNAQSIDHDGEGDRRPKIEIYVKEAVSFVSGNRHRIDTLLNNKEKKHVIDMVAEVLRDYECYAGADDDCIRCLYWYQNASKSVLTEIAEAIVREIRRQDEEEDGDIQIEVDSSKTERDQAGQVGDSQ